MKGRSKPEVIHSFQEKDISDRKGFSDNKTPGMIQERCKFSKYLVDWNRFRFRTVVGLLGIVFLLITMFCAKYGKNVTLGHARVSADPFSAELSCIGGQYLEIGVSNNNNNKGQFCCPNILCDVDIRCALTYFYRICTNEVKHFLKQRHYKNISNEIDGILYYTGRILPSHKQSNSNELSDVMLDLSTISFCVPLTDKYSPVAYSIVSEVHTYHKDVKHAGVESVLRYCNMVAYIIGGRSLVKLYMQNCIRCRILKKKNIQVEMGLVPEGCLKIAPAFYRTQVDLFGPFDSYSNLNKRKMSKSDGGLLYWVLFNGFCKVFMPSRIPKVSSPR